jgi:hypothetical protein
MRVETSSNQQRAASDFAAGKQNVSQLFFGET